MSRKPLRSLVHDTQGSILAEFAALMPVMITIALVTFIVVTRMRVQSQVTMAASSVVDLIGQQKTINLAQLSDVCDGISLMVTGAPYASSSASLTVAVGSFASANGQPAALWAKDCLGNDLNSAPLTAIATPYFQDGQPDDKLIVGIVTYTFNSNIAFGDYLSSFTINVSSAQFPRNASVPTQWSGN